MLRMRRRLMHGCLMHALPSAVGCGSVTIAVAAHVRARLVGPRIVAIKPALALISTIGGVVVLVAESALIV